MFHSDATETSPDDYRGVSPWAVVGLVLGIASFAALAAPPAWIIPIAAGLISYVGLQQTRPVEGNYAGRSLAWTGMFLSIVFVVAGPTWWITSLRGLEAEAKEFAAVWFQLLRDHKPAEALELTHRHQLRRAHDDELAKLYEQPDERAKLQKFVDHPAIRPILTLGDKANVRFYEVVDSRSDDFHEIIWPTYAVTYTEDGVKKSFLVALMMIRQKQDVAHADRWYISSYSLATPPQN